MNSILLIEATKLSVPERIDLVEAIWDSVANDSAALPLSEDHRLELDHSLDELAANPDVGSPWAEVRARLEKKR